MFIYFETNDAPTFRLVKIFLQEDAKRVVRTDIASSVALKVAFCAFVESYIE